MRQLTKPIWSEGMYLGPHHFQAQSRYFEDSLNFVTSSLWRDAFGFAGLQIDNDALRNGTISLVHARGLFEDGLAFDLPGSDAVVLPLDFATLFSPVADHLTLHLAVPVNLRDGRNTSLENTAAAVRYLGTEQIMPDQNTGRDEKPIRIGRKNLLFLAESEVTDQFASLPLVRVTRDGSGHFEADPTFVPPCLSLSASSTLIGMLRRLIDILDEKSVVISSEQQERKGIFQAGMSARHVAHYWFLHALNSNVPVLRHFLLSNHVQPLRCSGDQSGGLFELLKALRILPDHDLLYYTFNNPHDRLRQSCPATPATGSIAPLDEFATAATNLVPFLAHDVTSQVESVPASIEETELHIGFAGRRPNRGLLPLL